MTTLSLFDAHCKLDEIHPAAITVLKFGDHHIFLMEQLDTQGIRSFETFYQNNTYKTIDGRFCGIGETLTTGYYLPDDDITSAHDLFEKLASVPFDNPTVFEDFRVSKHASSAVTYKLSKENFKLLQTNLQSHHRSPPHETDFHDSLSYVQFQLKKIGLTYQIDNDPDFGCDCYDFVFKALGAIALTAGVVLFTAAVLGALGVIALPSTTATIVTGAAGAALFLAGSYALGFFSSQPKAEHDDFVGEPTFVV